MNLCLRFVTSTMMGLDLAVLMTAALLCLPVVSADEGEGEGGGGTTTLFDCTLRCDCINVTGNESCRVTTEPKCGTECFCTGAGQNRRCYNRG